LACLLRAAASKSMGMLRDHLCPPKRIASKARRSSSAGPGLTQLPLCPTRRRGPQSVSFVPPTLPSLVRHARAACVCLCSTAHKRGVCAPVALCGGCCWWAGIHRPAAAAACQSFFYDFYKKLTELSASNFRLVEHKGSWVDLDLGCGLACYPKSNGLCLVIHLLQPKSLPHLTYTG
jgi:hypothetical protein